MKTYNFPRKKGLNQVFPTFVNKKGEVVLSKNTLNQISPTSPRRRGLNQVNPCKFLNQVALRR
jgi:hypothetical protein